MCTFSSYGVKTFEPFLGPKSSTLNLNGLRFKCLDHRVIRFYSLVLPKP